MGKVQEPLRVGRRSTSELWATKLCPFNYYRQTRAAWSACRSTWLTKRAPAPANHTPSKGPLKWAPSPSLIAPWRSGRTPLGFPPEAIPFFSCATQSAIFLYTLRTEYPLRTPTTQPLAVRQHHSLRYQSYIHRLVPSMAANRAHVAPWICAANSRDTFLLFSHSSPICWPFTCWYTFRPSYDGKTNQKNWKKSCPFRCDNQRKPQWECNNCESSLLGCVVAGDIDRMIV